MKFFNFLISAFSALTLANGSSSFVVSKPSLNLPSQAMAFSGVQIKSVKLLAREERRLPSGATPDPNRDIGFASVFLRIENTQEKNVVIVIKRIEICDISNGTIQMASQSPQEIILKPLENSENAFHLTNKIGYSAPGKVKAVVNYQIGEHPDITESEPVEVERL